MVMRIQRAANSAHRLCLCMVIFLCSARSGAFAQQSYAGEVGDCSIGSSTATSVRVGYTCSEAQPTCQTYAYYRTQQGQTLSDVATLFGSTGSALADANSISSSSSLSSNQPLFIPLSCACSSSYSVMEIPYTIQSGDSFYGIANTTFQGLTTCGGIQNSNPSVTSGSLQPGSSLTIPLRCACPSQEQLDQDIKLLITYPVVAGDDPSKISMAFGADTSRFQAANGFSQNAVIYPQTTVLVPLAQKPQIAPVLETNTSPSPPSGGKSSHVGMYVGIAIGACLALFLIVLAVFCFMKKRNSGHDARLSEAPLMQQTDTKSSGVSDNYEIDMSKINNKLYTYTAEEIFVATEGCNPSHHVKGSVYRGMLREQVVAIKKIDRNIAKEVSTFRNLHHSNLVPLLGVCIGSQESFLVYPFIGEGSVKDWLQKFPHKESPQCLNWCGRVQIAVDIAIALEYLHEYTKPSFLHKNVTSSNILVDANLRGKLSNFGLAKSYTEDMEQRMAQTSHIEGTQGYLAPEYLNDGEVSAKTDVFAFGVVLAEMLSGKNPIIRDIEGSQLPGKHGFLWEHMSTISQGDDTFARENFTNWMDPVLKGKYPIHCAMKMSELAKQCVTENPVMRPSIRSTAATLSEVLEASQKWESRGAHDGILGR